MESVLSRKLVMTDVRGLVAWCHEDASHLEWLWKNSKSEDRRTSVNALWVMTHLPESDREWLESLQNELVDMLVAEEDGSKKRLLLQLLRNQTFKPYAIRSDLIDFCFSKINSESEPYAVRCFSMYLAFNLCRDYPELISELEVYLDLLESQSLSAGLRSGLRQTRVKIARIRRKQ